MKDVIIYLLLTESHVILCLFRRFVKKKV